jgi:hypothetical protein
VRLSHIMSAQVLKDTLQAAALELALHAGTHASFPCFAHCPPAANPPQTTTHPPTHLAVVRCPKDTRLRAYSSPVRLSPATSHHPSSLTCSRSGMGQTSCRGEGVETEVSKRICL